MDHTVARVSSGFVRIPEGWFDMGCHDGREDERPVHRVWVDAFELAVFPVTERQYADFLVATSHEPPRDWPATPARDTFPVVGVSWFDANAYCAWLATRGLQGRLPTEAEWERAARGHLEGAAYPWGDAIPSWVPNAGRGSLDGPWAVTLGEPNDFGVYGIAGNIHEWCADWYDGRYYATSPERNPQGPPGGSRRASRGGSWRHAWTVSRCATRSRIDPSFRYTDYGFRVARSAPP
ncbi:MAG: formylglycine-generating enzyme family protein [Vicinamibacterales bacterium]